MISLLLVESSLLNQYPSPTYQDILIENQVVAIGTQHCAPRYERIKPILASYKKPFTVLEIGAAQGYFTFRIAHDFPDAFCTMIEEDTPHYSYHGSLLSDLCSLNKQLTNIYLLRREISLEDLEQYPRFDVIIAFLVIHQMHPDFDQQKEILNSILRLGDQVLIEVAPDASPLLTTYTEYLSRKLPCEYLGELKRDKDPNASEIGQMYWFKN